MAQIETTSKEFQKAFNYPEIPWVVLDETKETGFANFQPSNKTELHTSFMQAPTIKTNISRRHEPTVLVIGAFGESQVNVCNSDEHGIEDFIAEHISEIPAVEYIFFSKDQDSIEIWTVINKLDRKIRTRIYNIEYAILEHFKELYFDFHIICRTDRDIEDISPSNAILLFQR